MILQKTEITFRTYEEAIQKTEVLNKDSHFTVYQLGLSGEIGELLTEIKKDKRWDVGDIEHSQAICQELGDCLWYLAQMCRLVDGSLHKIAGFDDYTCIDVIQKETKDNVIFELANDLVIYNGILCDELKKECDVKKVLNDLLCCLVAIASTSDMSLSEIAQINMEKTLKRFGNDFSHLKWLDDSFPDFEQLPRELNVEIRQEWVGKTQKAMLFINGFMYGNPLDDNISGEEDYFRYP